MQKKLRITLNESLEVDAVEALIDGKWVEADASASVTEEKRATTLEKAEDLRTAAITVTTSLGCYTDPMCDPVPDHDCYYIGGQCYCFPC